MRQTIKTVESQRSFLERIMRIGVVPLCIGFASCELRSRRGFILSEIHMAMTGIRLFVCLLALGDCTLARADCFKSVREIKANNIKTRWQETTENDGKPMTISISDGPGGPVFSAKKAGAPWLSGNVSVCRSGDGADITLRNTKATNNVPWITRVGLPSTLSAHIEDNQIKLAGGGWSGTFVGQ